MKAYTGRDDRDWFCAKKREPFWVQQFFE